jgi:hypothetical protein
MIKKFLNYSVLGVGAIIVILGLSQMDIWISLAGFWQTLVGIDLVFDSDKR